MTSRPQHSVRPARSIEEQRAAARADRRARSAPARRPGHASRHAAGAAPKAHAQQTIRAVLAPGVATRRALFVVTLLLLLYGLVMAYSASAAQAYFEHGSTYYLIGRQVVFAGLGLAALWALSRVDYVWYKKMALPVAGGALLLLVLVLIPGVGVVVNGARRWIVVGGQGFQPSEIAKIAAVMLIATLVAARPGEVTKFKHFLLLAAVGVVPAAALIMRQPDLGSTLVLTGAVFAVLVAGGSRLRHLALLGAVGVAAIVAMIISEPYRLERLMTFFDPWRDAADTGYQATQSLISVASGGLFGVGLGNSVQKFGYLPEQDTDMIVGIIGEELGLFGLVGLIALYSALAWVCFRVALTCKDMFGKLLATGIAAIIVGQACINIGAALGALPLTGVPLPLVSLGGTSLVVVLASIGILMNIATNRRSFIAASPQRNVRAAGRGGDGRPPAANPRGRG